MKPFLTAWLLAGAALSSSWAVMPAPRPPRTSRLGALHLRGRFGFEPNMGQADRGFDFVARGRDYSLAVSAHELVLTYFEGFGDVDQWFRDEVVRLKLVGAQNATPRGAELLPGKSVFRLRADIPNYAQVIYQDVYPGIDLVYSGDQKCLKLQFVIREGGRPESIRLEWGGARRARAGPDGTLGMRSPTGEIQLLRPISYNSFDGERQDVAGRFARVHGNRAVFQPPL